MKDVTNAELLVEYKKCPNYKELGRRYSASDKTIARRVLAAQGQIDGAVQPAPPAGRPKGTKKRGRGRPKGSKNKVKRSPGRPRKSASGLGSLDNLVATITNLQKDRDQALAIIDKIRRLVNA